MLLLTAPYGDRATDAFRFASERGVLPTWMGTAELRELAAAIKERAVFSARTTHAVYLQGLAERINRLIEDGYNSDPGQLRLELQEILAELGYDPETGFPGDAELGIPPARPGSLQDLASSRRINLILETQQQLMAGRGQQQRGMTAAAVDLFPAWELVRVSGRRQPRDWDKRWTLAGGVIRTDSTGKRRLVARKDDEIWSVLGDPAVFPDALGVAHPPFAFSSGMGWDPIEAEEWNQLVGAVEPPRPAAPATPTVALPPAVSTTDGLTPELAAALAAKMQNAEATRGRLSLKSVFSEAPPPPPSAAQRARARRAGVINARLDLLEHLADLQEEWNVKRCGRGWIPDWKRCRKGSLGVRSGKKGGKFIGKTGDWASFGLPALDQVPQVNISHRASRDEARAMIRSGTLDDADPLGRRVRFGSITERHLLTKDKAGDIDRARWLNHARATLERPLEIWEHRHRHYYMGQFQSRKGVKPFIVVCARTGERDNEVISFHTETVSGINKDRQGKLLYASY